MKTVIWLEDNPDSLEDDIKDIKKTYPSLKIEVWDGNYENGNNRGKRCLEDFKNKIVLAQQQKDDVIGFILDVRIPVTNLSDLGLPNIETDNGLITGLQIASYYLRNKDNISPFGSEFKETPILLFTVAGGIAEEYPWVLDKGNNYSFIEKTTDEKINEVSDWLGEL